MSSLSLKVLLYDYLNWPIVNRNLTEYYRYVEQVKNS